MKKKYYIITIIIALILVGGGILIFVFFSNGPTEVTNTSVNINSVKFESNEYGYSLTYPAGWWHTTVPAENLGNAPYSATHLLSIEEFGMGNQEDYKNPYSDKIMMLNFSVSVYTPRDNYKVEDISQELDLENSEYLHENLGTYNVTVKVTDNSNHEIASARMYSKTYYLQNGDRYYALDFATLNKSNFDQNLSTIKNILNTFTLL